MSEKFSRDTLYVKQDTSNLSLLLVYEASSKRRVILHISYLWPYKCNDLRTRSHDIAKVIRNSCLDHIIHVYGQLACAVILIKQNIIGFEEFLSFPDGTH